MFLYSIKGPIVILVRLLLLPEGGDKTASCGPVGCNSTLAGMDECFPMLMESTVGIDLLTAY